MVASPLELLLLLVPNKEAAEWAPPSLNAIAPASSFEIAPVAVELRVKFKLVAIVVIVGICVVVVM